MSILLFLLWGCRSADIPKEVVEDSVSSPSNPASEQTNDVDIDQDGFPEGVDCDDWDPFIHPQAIELFDHIDNNCDGIIDFDGVFSGVLNMSAVAIFEGEPYSFLQSCSGVLSRERGVATMLIECAIDQSQEKADILLGEALSFVAQTNILHTATWEPELILTSSSGWSTGSVTNMSWSALEDDLGSTVEIDIRIDTISLDMTLTGKMFRQST